MLSNAGEHATTSSSYSVDRTRLATGSEDGSVRVWHHSGEHSAQWPLAGYWMAHGGAIRTVAWAPPDFGQILASCASDGVRIWAEERGACTNSWHLTCVLTEDAAAAAFAPQEAGLLLAVASVEGKVRLYEPSGLLAPTLWHCTSSFQAIPRGRCRILDWRPHCGRQSKVLLVGGDGGARAWIFRKAAGRWAPTALFAEAKRVVAANWAPTLSRPVELVAIATETSVRIWSLAGRLHTPQVELVAELDRGLPEVWKLEWNVLGNCLAVSTKGGLYLSRPNLADGAAWLSTTMI